MYKLFASAMALASANASPDKFATIDLKTDNFGDEIGSLYAGSQQELLQVSFDTLTEYTVLTDSFYDEKASESIKQIKEVVTVPNKTADCTNVPKNVTCSDTMSVSQPVTVDLKVGKPSIHAELYTDNFCLLMKGSWPRTVNDGYMCAKNLTFALSTQHYVKFQGIIGLAPGKNSYIKYLYDNGDL